MTRAAPRTRPDYRCAGCRKDIDRLGEYAYMLKDRVWKQLTERAARAGRASIYDLCCIDCAERRLGRRITYVDFDWNIRLNTCPSHRSERLRDAMAREP